MTEGPPRIFVPVCKHPKHYQRTTGPLGWVEVETVTECPLLVEPPEKEEDDEDLRCEFMAK